MAWVKLENGVETNISTDAIDCPPEIDDLLKVREYLTMVILSSSVQMSGETLKVVETSIMASIEII